MPPLWADYSSRLCCSSTNVPGKGSWAQNACGELKSLHNKFQIQNGNISLPALNVRRGLTRKSPIENLQSKTYGRAGAAGPVCGLDSASEPGGLTRKSPIENLQSKTYGRARPPQLVPPHTP